MGFHRFPVKYGITGKKANAKRESGGIGYHTIDLRVREVDEIETTVIGTITHGSHSEQLLYFEDKFWIKDAYKSEDAKAIRSDSYNTNIIDEFDKARSTFKDQFYREWSTEWDEDKIINASSLKFKTVIVNQCHEIEHELAKMAKSHLIEINEELYFRVSEPFFILYVSRGCNDRQADVTLAFDDPVAYEHLSKLNDIIDLNNEIRFPFDKRHELQLLIDDLTVNNGVTVNVHMDGEYYYGGRFTAIQEEARNLRNSAKHIVRNQKHISMWPITQIVAWGNVRDALIDVLENQSDETSLDALGKAMRLYTEVKDRVVDTNYIDIYALAALSRWDSRNIDLDVIDMPKLR